MYLEPDHWLCAAALAAFHNCCAGSDFAHSAAQTIAVQRARPVPSKCPPVAVDPTTGRALTRSPEDRRRRELEAPSGFSGFRLTDFPPSDTGQLKGAGLKGSTVGERGQNGHVHSPMRANSYCPYLLGPWLNVPAPLEWLHLISRTASTPTATNVEHSAELQTRTLLQCFPSLSV